MEEFGRPIVGALPVPFSFWLSISWNKKLRWKYTIIPEKSDIAMIATENLVLKNHYHKKVQNYGEEKYYFFLGAAFFLAFFASGFFAAAFFAAAMWFPPPTGKGYIFSQSAN